MNFFFNKVHLHLYNPCKDFYNNSLILTQFRMETKRPPHHPPPSPPQPAFPLGLLQAKELASKTFWHLVATFLPNLCKISMPYVVAVPNY